QSKNLRGAQELRKLIRGDLGALEGAHLLTRNGGRGIRGNHNSAAASRSGHLSPRARRARLRPKTVRRRPLPVRRRSASAREEGRRPAMTSTLPLDTEISVRPGRHFKQNRLSV